MTQHQDDEDIEDQGCDSHDQESYVGYGHPPKHSRWQKGYCPNPSGRPAVRKTRSFYLRQVALRQIEARDGRRMRTMTVLEAIVLIVKSKAIGGHVGASKLFEKLNGLDVAPSEYTGPRGVLIVPEKLTMEEWDAIYGSAAIVTARSSEQNA